MFYVRSLVFAGTLLACSPAGAIGYFTVSSDPTSGVKCTDASAADRSFTPCSTPET